MANYCRRCGCKDIPEGTETCPECGNPISKPVVPNPAKKKQFTPKNNPYVIPPGTEQSKGPWIIIAALVLVIAIGVWYIFTTRNNSQTASNYTVPAVSDHNTNGTATDNVALPESEQDTTSDNSSNSETASEEEPEEITPSSTVRTGTVYLASDANPNRIRVRSTPGLDGNDTTERLYNGDRVTVYEETTKDGYTWYRIGDNKWMADNGESFGVKFD